MIGVDDAPPVVACATAHGGSFRLAVTPRWAPRGAARFLELVRSGFYDGAAISRVVPGVLAQWGIGADPEARRALREDGQ